jgi:hypothetical protein
MKVLKGFGLAILGILLSLSLIVFGFLFMLNQTALNPDFVTSEVNSLDIPKLAEEMFSEEVPQGQEYMTDLVVQAANETITEQESWLKQQANDATYAFYDYLEGRSEHLSVEIPLETIEESLRDNLWEAVLDDPPPELEGLPPAEMEQEFNQFWDEFSEEIPSTLELDETSLDPEVMTHIEQARQYYVDYFKLVFFALIGLILLLILGIVLIHRQVKGATRQIGITFLTYGAIFLAGVLVAKNLGGSQLAQLDITAYLQTWLPHLLSDILAPLQWYSIGFLAAGVVLLIVSFVYKRGESSPQLAGL